ncbi:T9SS type A sorting domain-containing protein [Flavilitoribacter nigricans]|uniref:T9SS type A sorting domain-containing protein n=1 Tax=Flavilitoribacter nigricans (strain ATCC 23147 / DSM 23189 / NBRC 102662 / NCIMB 1420 / SS-2) TaxID=1122177 RepID=A0A2D0NC41_FLAN2|nr:T9SS type A sorting domain-containing protein [Flavilitoribacter nigricans]PHN05749.1 hypothetical protein CRP01_14835 [Flavilitoribacter nigricans DSM 23189 = NBRC 102662]
MRSSIVLFLTFFGLLLQAQITITSSTLPALGDQLKYSWAYDQATFGMITPPGFDLSWDFSGLTADESLTETFLAPDGGQYVYRFPGANLMTQNAAGEERYYLVSGSGLKLKGWTENNLFGEPFNIVYDYTWKGRLPNGGLDERITPLNFFDSYSQSASLLEGFKFSELPPAIRNAYLAAGLTTTDSVRIRSSISTFYAVNAYGTATIPSPDLPVPYPVLRLAVTQYKETRMDAHVIPLGWLDITDLSMQYFPASAATLGIDTSGFHIFLNDLTREEIARITLDSQGRPHHVRFKNEAPPGCFNPDLVDPTIDDDPIPSGNYAASQTITSAGRVADGSTVEFLAGIQVTLEPGFIAEAGSSFKASVIDCSPTLARSGPGEEPEIKPYSIPPGDLPGKTGVAGHLNIYPNPVHTSASIAYHLSSPGPVWLGISDSRGRLLQELETTNWQTAGTHVLEWTPPDRIAPGLFLVSLKTNEGLISKKMVWIR